MSEKIADVTVYGKRDTASNWTSNDTILGPGEWGHETDTNKSKRGDGSTAWTSLVYAVDPADRESKLTGSTDQLVKAWANFDGTSGSPATIRNSYNISSITRSSTGVYVLNFTNLLPDANYAVIVTGNFQTTFAGGGIGGTTGTGANNKTTAACEIRTASSSSLVDPAEISVMILSI